MMENLKTFINETLVIVMGNYVFFHFMGISTVLGSAKKPCRAVAMGAAVTAVMVIAAAIAWPVQNFVLAAYGLEYLQTLTFTAIVLMACAVAGVIAKAVVKKPLGIFFPLIALNSAVLGVVANNAGAETFVDAVLAALYAGIGFLVAMLVFAGVQKRIENQYVPAAFRGLPVQLMAAVIVALALYAF